MNHSHFPASRAEALRRLSDFVPKAGATYAAKRNYDLGPGQHHYVSGLSPYIRHRVITEEDVLEAVLARFSPQQAEKFVQELYWRTYWKGWLELRPSVWDRYQVGLAQALDMVQTQAGLRQQWQAACLGKTGIGPLDSWARELVETGYLHNHARMWFASIWVFTLRLPWELGADFFLRHLLDGDPASNTLGWRWVAGLQTRGKTYLARAGNIARYTESRLRVSPGSLASEAIALDGPAHPPCATPPVDTDFDPDVPTAFVLHEDDLSPGWLFDRGLTPVGTALLTPNSGLSPLEISPDVLTFRKALVAECAERWANRLGPQRSDFKNAAELSNWARAIGAKQIVTAYAPKGAVCSVLNDISDIPVHRLLRRYDAQAWPYATAGFFKFKENIPRLLNMLPGLSAA